MFSVGTFVITGTDMWVRCPLNKSNSGHSFTGFEKPFCKGLGFHPAEKKLLDLVTTSINCLIVYASQEQASRVSYICQAVILFIP